MSIAQMRAALMKVPYGPSWIPKVEKMSDGAVRATYMRMLDKKQITS